MTNHAGFDFTKFVPGFDFLKNLTPGGAAASASTAAPGWVAPTLDPEELEKRIQELKTVQFWLEQNAKAVGATIQALDVQRMTLATLKGMNMSFNDLAESLKVKPQATAAASPFAFTPAPEPAPQAAAAPEPEPDVKPQEGETKAAGIDPAHWWGALTDQFQNIAKHAMTDMAQRASAHASAATTPSAKAATPPKAKTKPAAKRVRKPAVKRATAAKPAAKRSSKPAAR